jgi:hypothetical protein
MSVPYSVGTPRRTRGATNPHALHAGKPWRVVEHIDEQVGTQGGHSWVLTLECGHHAFRPIPRIASDTMAAIFGKLVTAPKKVRCLWCETP